MAQEICFLCKGTGQIEGGPRSNSEKLKLIKAFIKKGGYSYQEIGDMPEISLHKSTVGYYVKKYKLKVVRADLIVNPETQAALDEL